jgi:hypothetical protein
MYVFTHDRGKVTEILTMREVNGAWTVAKGDVRSYTVSGLLATRTEYSTVGTYSKGIQSYQYDLEGRIVSRRYAYMLGIADTPEYESLDSSGFNAQGDQVYSLSQVWRGGTLTYSEEWLYTFTTDTSVVCTSARWERGDWVDRSRSILDWSAGNRGFTLRSLTWNGATWVETYLWEMTFDEEMRILTDSGYECIDGTWVGVYRSTTRYGISEPFLNQWEDEEWKGTAWALRGRGQWTTDASGRTRSYASRSWRDGVVSDETGAFVYGADGSVRQTDTTWSDGALRVVQTYLMDASGRELLSEGYWWDERMNSWEGHQRSTTCTPAGHESERVVRKWSGGSWHPVERYLFCYDEAGRIRSIEYFVGVRDHWASARDQQTQGDSAPWGGDWWFNSGSDLGVSFGGFYDLTFTYREGVNGVGRFAEGIPEHSALQQNYPNPFNPTTTLPFSVATGAQTTIVIFDVLGREVARPVDTWKDPGEYRVEFDAKGLASGMYICRFSSGDVNQTRKLMLVR